MNKREAEQLKAKDHLQVLLDIENGLTIAQIKWIEIFNIKMIDEETFSKREMEIIYNIYQQSLVQGIL